MEHPDWPAFVAAIVADPDDDTARVVAADFLEENGDPDRAAFIRIQVQLARLEATGQGKSLEADELRKKERAFLGPLSLFPSFWAAEDCPELVGMPARGGGRGPLEGMRVEGVERLRWRRGFIEAVRCPAEVWLRHGDAVRRRLPIRTLTLDQCDRLDWDDWRAMRPTFPKLQRIVLWGGEMVFAVRDWLRLQLPGTQVMMGLEGR